MLSFLLTASMLKKVAECFLTVMLTIGKGNVSDIARSLTEMKQTLIRFRLSLCVLSYPLVALFFLKHVRQ